VLDNTVLVEADGNSLVDIDDGNLNVDGEEVSSDVQLDRLLLEIVELSDVDVGGTKNNGLVLFGRALGA